MTDTQRQPRELAENVITVFYDAHSALPWLVQFWDEPVEHCGSPQEYSYQRHKRYMSFGDVLTAHRARMEDK